MFYKGYVHSEEEKQKAKSKRYQVNGVGGCVVCGEEFNKYVKMQNTCERKACRTTKTSFYYRSIRDKDPIASLAYRLSGSLRMGKGKIDVMKGLLADAIGKPCDYCGLGVTQENASVDHKTPRKFNKVWDFRTKRMIYTKGEIIELDKPSNLHIVCRPCNQMKSDLNDDQFRRFMSFLESNTDLKENIVTRLSRARVVFSRIREKRRV